MRRICAISSVSAAACVAGLLLWGQTSLAAPPAAAPEKRAPAVTIARVERQDISEEVHVSGTLVAREEVLVTPEIDGLAVTEILVEEGDEIKKGQVLARLSRTSLDAESAQAAATLAQSRAQIAEARASVLETSQALQRYETLRKSGTASAQQYDQTLAAAQVAAARLNAAQETLKLGEAQKQLIDVRLARAEIRAPAAGIISRRTLRLGAIASMVAEPAFRIIENGALELNAEVVDSTLARFKIGQKVRVLPAGFTEPLDGTIRLISAEVDPVTRLGRVRVALPAEARPMLGAFASGVVEIGRHTALTLPITAVTFSVGESSVQALDGNSVVTKAVKTGLRAPTRIEIVSGLEENETVVARAGSFLREGDLVTPIEPQAAQDARQ
jgi:HlyD family secretion protein